MPLFSTQLLVAGCSTNTEAPVLHDLIEMLPHAEVTHPTTVIDLGQTTARRALSQGWANDETGPDGVDFVYAISTESQITFEGFVDPPTQLRFAARPYEYEGLPTQHVEVALNGHVVAMQEMSSGWNEYQFTIPDEAWGDNHAILSLKHAFAARPADVQGNQDNREIAAAYDYLRLEWTNAKPSWTSTSIHLPQGSSVTYYARLPTDGRLTFDGVQGSAVATLSPVGGTPSSQHPISNPTASIDLSPDADRLMTIELSAPDKAAVLAGPAIRGRQSNSELRRGRANVLVYVVDSLRADHLGTYGYGLPTSPRIDAFGAEAMVFERALAQSSWTRPAVASILTGLYPPTHGVDRPGIPLPASISTWPEYMASQLNYDTFAVITNGIISGHMGFDQGFDDFVYLPEDTKGRVHQTAAQVNTTFWKWLDERAEPGPFFAYLHISDPHFPYTPESKYCAPFAEDCTGPVGSASWMTDLRDGLVPNEQLHKDALIGRYDAEIAYVDEQFAHLLVGLEERGLTDDTMVVFTSDHGEEFFEHGDWEHGTSLFDELVQVPLIIKLPPSWGQAPQRPQHLVQQVDIFPTVVDLLGAAPPEDIDGGNRLKELAPQAGFTSLRVPGRTLDGVVSEEWKLVRGTVEELPVNQLYQRSSDPSESMDLSGTEPAKFQELDAMLSPYRARQPIHSASESGLPDDVQERLRILGYVD